MSASAETGDRLRRLPSGRIEAPDGYVEYDGQLVIRTRYATIQRWKSSGWDPRRKPGGPYLLADTYCTGESSTLEPRNDHLDAGEIEIYYVEASERIIHKVEGTSA